MFSNFSRLDVHNGSCLIVAIYNEDSRFSYNNQKCIFVDSFIEYIGLVFTVKCGVVIEISRCSPISFKHIVSLCCLFSNPHLTTHRSNLGIHFRKVIELGTPHTSS